LSLAVRTEYSVSHACLWKLFEEIDPTGRVFEFRVDYCDYGWFFVQVVRPRREFDRSETPVYLFLNRKNDQFLRLFRVEVSETVFSIRLKSRAVNADINGACALDREIQTQVS